MDFPDPGAKKAIGATLAHLGCLDNRFAFHYPLVDNN
jgi:hypothetical protein